MKTEKTEPKTRENAEKDAKRRPYEKPGFLSSMAFERSSLACDAPKNTAPFLGCNMQS
jgi:hypothetical protein